MPVTAPTSSAIVTTRIARLRFIFQLVMRFGTIAGNISLPSYCSAAGGNERTMRRNSRGTLRMASNASIRKTGPQTAISTKAMRKFHAAKPQHREQDPGHHRNRHEQADHRPQIVFEPLRLI